MGRKVYSLVVAISILFLHVLLFSIFSKPALATHAIPGCDYKRSNVSTGPPTCPNPVNTSDCSSSGTVTGNQCCSNLRYDYCFDYQFIGPPFHYDLYCCLNPTPTPTSTPTPTPTPTPIPPSCSSTSILSISCPGSVQTGADFTISYTYKDAGLNSLFKHEYRWVDRADVGYINLCHISEGVNTCGSASDSFSSITAPSTAGNYIYTVHGYADASDTQSGVCGVAEEGFTQSCLISVVNPPTPTPTSTIAPTATTAPT